MDTECLSQTDPHPDHIHQVVDDDDIPPPLTKTEQDLLNRCLYSSANLHVATEAVQLVCVEVPTACNGDITEEEITVKKETVLS